MLKRTVRAWNSSISGLRLRASSAFSKPPISVSSFVTKPCQDLRTTSSTAMVPLEALHTVLGLRLENSSNVGGTNKRQLLSSLAGTIKARAASIYACYRRAN